MRDDPIVAEVRRTREELAARFNFDVEAIFADMQSRQATLGSRLVFPKKRGGPVRGPSAESSDGANSVIPVKRLPLPIS